VAHLGQRRLANLDRHQRRAVRDYLRQSGSIVDDGQMRSLRRQKVRELDSDTYHHLLRDLGDQVVAQWDGINVQDLGAEQRALLSSYLGRRIMGRIERLVLLHTISRLWIDYLTDIEDLRRGIGLEAYGQRDPLIEYKRRAFELFSELGDNIRRTVVRSLFRQPPEPLNA
jgi:preprotein translocase subunit SecA